MFQGQFREYLRGTRTTAKPGETSFVAGLKDGSGCSAPAPSPAAVQPPAKLPQALHHRSSSRSGGHRAPPHAGSRHPTPRSLLWAAAGCWSQKSPLPVHTSSFSFTYAGSRLFGLHRETPPRTFHAGTHPVHSERSFPQLPFRSRAFMQCLHSKILIANRVKKVCCGFLSCKSRHKAASFTFTESFFL